jgi:alpha-N-acetylglucosaminidase
MKRKAGLLGWVLAAVLVAQEAKAQAPPEQAARDLVRRVLPANAFRVEIIPVDQGRDVFEIESRGDKIVLRGNNGVAVGSALNWYLKYYCQCHYSLKAQQMRLPKPLPRVQPKIRRVSQDRWRYFLNYCCFGYSLPWYDWKQWERLIDWMALNGVNAPLSVTGQEAVWAQAGARLGFSEEDIRSFLAGPPFLPFGWMGCLDGWGGPLPESWVPRHEALQKQILARERALGMTPVLQGFTGHVPPATASRFPGTRLHKVRWIEWETCLLDPLDPLFGRMATTFLQEQRRLFGTDHLYAADTFIEMTPPSGETNFLAATGRAIYDGMAKTDPQAVWVLQGWTFFNQAQFWTRPRIESFLGAVPDSQMLVLDLFCDVTPVWNRTRAFCGKPWVWCALQNFGDCVYLGGALNRIHTDLPDARRNPLGSKLSGIGFVNEGLDYNPIVFDFLFEQAWRTEPVDLDQWVRDYARRASGGLNPDSKAAWDILKKTAFAGQHEVVPAFTAPPSFKPAGPLPYSNERLAQAWELLLKAGPAAGKSDAYRFDLVSVTRQVLANYSAELQAQATDAWGTKDRKTFQAASNSMLSLIRDLDELLATRPEYLLGNWLEDARRWGGSRAEKDRLEWNARRVLTMWGDQTQIRDYSRRQWSGMLTGFYLPRWEKFFAAADAALASGASFDEVAFDRGLQDWERHWADRHESYPTRPRGDSIRVSRRLWETYHPALAKLYAPEEPNLATGKPATCSSALPGHAAGLANDGKRSSTESYWATDIHNDKDPWWQVDLETPVTVGRVVVVGYYGDERYYGFIVEVSKDGEHWELVADHRDNHDLSTRAGYTCRFTPLEVRYLRVRQTSNSANTGRHLVEVMAFPE